MQRAPFSLRSVGPPRLDDAPPETGGCYAARFHVWVRFLLPRTILAMNANHTRQESAWKQTPAGGCDVSRGGPAERKREGGTLHHANIFAESRNGADRARSARRGALAKHKPSPMQPLRATRRQQTPIPRPPATPARSPILSSNRARAAGLHGSAASFRASRYWPRESLARPRRGHRIPWGGHPRRASD